MKKLKLLVISDCHTLTLEEVEKIKEITYDACIFLGDIEGKYLDWFLRYVPKEKAYGILGNHDTFDLLEKRNITNLHLNCIEINGVKIMGFQGAPKYKNNNIFPLYTQEESEELLKNTEKVDILVSHDGPYQLYNSNNSHCGFIGITKYLRKNKIPLNIHGHHHINSKKKIRKTKVICVYRCCLISGKKIKKIF